MQYTHAQEMFKVMHKIAFAFFAFSNIKTAVSQSQPRLLAAEVRLH
jgi:hypothetical protein